MNVAIYHPWIYLKSGLERTILELARRSRHEWTIYTSHFDPEGTYPELAQLGVVELERVSVRRRYGAVIQAAGRILRTRLPDDRHDALVVCCDGLGALVNFRNTHLPTLCLCFTPLRAVYDEEYRRRHLDRATLLRPLALAAETAYRFIDRAAWRRFGHVVCISETVRDRVRHGGLYAEADMDVAYPGIPASHISPTEERDHYFFLPGRIMWTKNIELAVNAFKHFAAGGDQRFRLIIAGMVDRKSETYFERLESLAADEPRIEFRVNPTDAQMQQMYRRCYATLLSAFNEDLGLTPLEAGCHGKPTIAVARGGPTELIVDGGTGLLVEPEVAPYSAAMTRLAGDPQLALAMGRAAADRCKLFTWERFVDHMDMRLDTLHKRSGAALWRTT